MLYKRKQKEIDFDHVGMSKIEDLIDKIKSSRKSGCCNIRTDRKSTTTRNFRMISLFKRDKTLIKGHEGNTVRKEKGEEGRKEVPSKGHFQATRRVGHGNRAP
jgi:hypothetical protein